MMRSSFTTLALAQLRPYSVRDFVNAAAQELDMQLRWEGSGVNEVGRVAAVRDGSWRGFTGQRITDPSSGFRAARVELLRRLVLEQDQGQPWTVLSVIRTMSVNAG